eukprot:252713_1
MASESRQSSNRLCKFLKDNKYVITGVAAGALAYYVLKSNRSDAAPNWTPDEQDHTKSNEQITVCDDSSDDCKCETNIDYPTPMDAFNYGKREQILYTTATRTGNFSSADEGDFLAVVDVDPTSRTYCTIIAQVPLGKNQEIHHSGWNACASCYGMPGFVRKFLVLPALGAGDIHFIDIANPRHPKIHRTVSGKMIKEKYGLSNPHTTHCLPNGNIMVSFLGVDKNHEQNRKNGGVDFLWINDKFEVETRWIKDASQRPKYNYDFWYQPYHNIMVSSEWGTPEAFSQGLNPEHLKQGMYGTSIHFWNWNEHTLIKTETFDISKVCMPLECRFLHDPKSVHGLIGAALSSNVIHFYRNDQRKWVVNPDYIQVEGIEMSDWALPVMPGLISDVILSMDDKYLYFSCWLHGDIRQYDISDPFKPRLNSRCFLGGLLREDSGFHVKDKKKNKPPVVAKVKGTRMEGGPQMLQLSLDGRRLYVTNSLYSAFDKQFYPDMVKNGGQMMMIDVDLDNDGKMTLNKDFLVDFGKCKGGPARPHEMRYPGGDCTSDIFLVQ